MAKKNCDTIDLAAIEREDECLGQFLKLLCSLPRPLPGVITVRMLGDLRRVEHMARQAEIDRRRAAEQRDRDAAHAATLGPARDALADFAAELSGMDKLAIAPLDLRRLETLARQAEVDFERAVAQSGLTESHPSVKAFREVAEMAHI